MQENDEFIALIVYVDNILVTGNNRDKIDNLKLFLDKEFTIKEMGEANFFLGVEVRHTSQGILVGQHKYILGILTEFNMLEAKNCNTPFSS